jgi:U3 small nucleolar RNA-associated protein 19
LDLEKSDSQQALNTAMKLLTAEGKFLADGQDQEKNFPIVHMNQILTKLLSWEKQNKHLITKLSEFACYEDFLYFSWKLLLKNLTPTKLNHPNPIFIENYLEFLNVIIRGQKTQQLNGESSESSEFLCKQVKLEDPVAKRNINKIWNFIAQWEHNETTHRQLLVLLLEKILVHLEKPILLTDFLMDSLDAGGPISLLALQGIFVLIHKFNMSYPNIYEKLYAMFEPEIFHMKFKPRLFYLADIFLAST